MSDSPLSARSTTVAGGRFASCAAIALALISGCTVGTDYQRPEVVTPERWRIDYEGAASLANTAWWTLFNDPALDDLVRTALEQNKDLLVAASRIEQYKARLNIDEADYWPQLGYGVAGGPERLSENRPVPLPGGTDTTNSSYEVSVNAGWEIDLWGRIRRTTEAARADLLSNVENQRGVLLTLLSEVATSYVRLLALDRGLEIATKTLTARDQSLRLFKQKYEGGAVSALELAQVRSLYEEAAGVIPEVQRAIALQENALSVLIGRNPGHIVRGRKLDALTVPPVPGGVPADILANRPDIRRSEQELIAANARIGVARARYLPSISLTALFGYASTDLSNLIETASDFGRLGGNIVGDIFTGGRTSAQVRESEQIHRQLMIRYLGSIQVALRDVEDALVSRQTFAEQAAIENRRVEALQDYARLALARYEGGKTGYLEVLDAERTLFRAEIRQAEIDSEVYSALIGIYRAMGGGWQVAETKEGEPSAGASGVGGAVTTAVAQAASP